MSESTHPEPESSAHDYLELGLSEEAMYRAFFGDPDPAGSILIERAQAAELRLQSVEAERDELRRTLDEMSHEARAILGRFAELNLAVEPPVAEEPVLQEACEESNEAPASPLDEGGSAEPDADRSDEENPDESKGDVLRDTLPDALPEEVAQTPEPIDESRVASTVTREVCREYGMSQELLLGAQHPKRFSVQRNVYVLLLRDLGHTPGAIGRITNRTSHNIHVRISGFKKKMKEDPELAAQYTKLKGKALSALSGGIESEDTVALSPEPTSNQERLYTPPQTPEAPPESDEPDKAEPTTESAPESEEEVREQEIFTAYRQRDVSEYHQTALLERYGALASQYDGDAHDSAREALFKAAETFKGDSRDFPMWAEKVIRRALEKPEESGVDVEALYERYAAAQKIIKNVRNKVSIPEKKGAASMYIRACKVLKADEHPDLHAMSRRRKNDVVTRVARFIETLAFVSAVVAKDDPSAVPIMKLSAEDQNQFFRTALDGHLRNGRWRS